VTFQDAHFLESACFQGTTFEKAASFEDARFDCPASFAYDPAKHVEGSRRQETTFQGWADFRKARFYVGADFGGTRFEGRARFGWARFGTPRRLARGSFDGARFTRARSFGPMLGWGTISLDRASFEGNVRIGVSALTVSCVRTLFLSRTTLEVRFADIVLDDAEFGLPSVVAGAKEPLEEYDTDRPLDDAHLRALMRLLARRAGGEEDWAWRPRVWSLQRANVGNLTLSDVDLSICRFAGAHNLDKLRFEGADFQTVENVWGVGRRAVWEELKLEPDDPGEAERIARTYRALRKGREDNKDEPGAADFYYGEMEMRRKARRRKEDPPSAKRTSRTEWLVLWLYRLVSGYGLRSTRALIWLLVTVGLCAWGFQAFGFRPDQNYWRSLLFSVESAPSLFRPPTPGTEDGTKIVLSTGGHILQMVLRLLGPLFFGLALLALRARVKR
jgi:uncharacterized protein YjbI with pentapeptide repeats